MTLLANWLSPVTLRMLALALLHFLWQGAALGALAYVVMGFCRSASTRYAVGVGTLALMFAAPVGSFLFLQAQNQGEAAFAGTHENSDPLVSTSTPVLSGAKHLPSQQENAPEYFLWLVEAWFAGIVLLSLRSAGGFLMVERLRRMESTPLAAKMLERCLSLQRRMGVERVVRYCQSMRLDAPAVAGWIRPVVLIPVTAISGLSEEQLEAVIAHELAHIQRYDAFVHLFQVGVETLLFYHPAVWWIGKRIRAERENCCDDVAVLVCGSPATYARALTRMAEWKAAPQLVMSANRSPLVERIARLLGANRQAESFRGANLSAGVLCLFTALLAGSAFLGNVRHAYAQTPAPAPAAPARTTHSAQVPDTAFVVRPSDPDFELAATPAPAPAARAFSEVSPTPAPAAPQAAAPSATPAPQAAPSAPKQSYIDSLKDAGLTNLTVDELIGLKVQGVTGEYVKSMRDLGLKTDAGELIGMKVQGITPDYVKGMRDVLGQSLNSGELIGLKVQGVTPEYVRQMHDLGLKTDAGEIIGMKVQGVTPEYIRQMRDLGLKVDSGEIIGMKVQGVTPEYVKSFQAIGLHPNTDELIGMKVQGVTADYIKQLQASGFQVDIDEAIGAKVQGITPEFIAKAKSHGFKDLTLNKLIALKHTGVLDDEK